MSNSLRKGFIGVLISLLLLSPATALSADPAPEQAEPSPGSDLGYGVGSVLASMVYSPVKITYAGLGLLAGGLGFVVSAGSSDVANKIIYPAVGGNYVITPSHLKGKELVVFIAAPPPSDSQGQESASRPLPPQR